MSPVAFCFRYTFPDRYYPKAAILALERENTTFSLEKAAKDCLDIR
jgi:hypothetical protein